MQAGCACEEQGIEHHWYLSNESSSLVIALFCFVLFFFWPREKKKRERKKKSLKLVPKKSGTAKRICLGGRTCCPREIFLHQKAEERNEPNIYRIWKELPVKARENNFFPLRYSNTNGCYLKQVKSKRNQSKEETQEKNTQNQTKH